MKRVHIIVTGLVQGVFFRAFTKETAGRLKLSGWVRNLPDGSVEAVAEGEDKIIEEFISELKKGPPKARVDKAKAKYSDATGEFLGFSIKNSN